MQAHNKKHHSREKREACPSCGKMFIDRSGVARHITICHADRADILVCRKCGASFDTAVRLKEHISAAHEQKLPLNVTAENEQEMKKRLHLTCPYCLLPFASVLRLETHVQTHERHAHVELNKWYN